MVMADGADTSYLRTGLRHSRSDTSAPCTQREHTLIGGCNTVGKKLQQGNNTLVSFDRFDSVSASIRFCLVRDPGSYWGGILSEPKFRA